MNAEIGEQVSQFRYNIGAEILLLMQERKDLPLPNKYRLAKVMQEYFRKEGFVDSLKEQNYRWRPNTEYWASHLDDVRKVLREQYKKMFEYIWAEDGRGFEGEWKFADKAETEKNLKRENNGVATRSENFNDKLDGNPYDSDIPHIGDIPRLN